MTQHIKLNRTLKKMYLSLRQNVGLAENGSAVSKFNRALYAYLVECQQRQFMPSRDYMLEKCGALMDEAVRETILGPIEDDRLDARILDEAVQDMIILESLTNTDRRGETTNTLHLKVICMVPIFALSKREVGLLQESTHALEPEIVGDYIQVTGIYIPIGPSGTKPNSHGEPVRAFLVRVLRNRLSRLCKAKNINSEFRYSLIDRVRDMIFSSSL